MVTIRGKGRGSRGIPARGGRTHALRKPAVQKKLKLNARAGKRGAWNGLAPQEGGNVVVLSSKRLRTSPEPQLAGPAGLRGDEQKERNVGGSTLSCSPDDCDGERRKT